MAHKADGLMALWEATTAGLWRAVPEEERLVSLVQSGRQWVAAGVSQPDMAWICEAHALWPVLVRRITELEAEVAKLEGS